MRCCICSFCSCFFSYEELTFLRRLLNIVLLYKITLILYWLQLIHFGGAFQWLVLKWHITTIIRKDLILEHQKTKIQKLCWMVFNFVIKSLCKTRPWNRKNMFKSLIWILFSISRLFTSSVEKFAIRKAVKTWNKMCLN